MKHIASADNSTIRKAESLKLRKHRDKEGLYLIEGFNLCREALEANANIETFLIRKSFQTETKTVKTDKADKTVPGNTTAKAEYDLIGAINDSEIEAATVEDKLFDRLMDTETPQGIAAIVRKRTWSKDDFFKEGAKSNGGVLVLDRIQDPGNAGTLLRTAEAAAFLGVIVVKGTVDPYSPKVVRSAAGTLLRIPLLFTESGEETVELLHTNGKRIVTATPYCSNYHFQQRLKENIALVIGNEGGGVSDTFLDRSDIQVRIPMFGAVESLNAAVAAGILMFETVRQNFQKEVEE